MTFVISSSFVLLFTSISNFRWIARKDRSYGKRGRKNRGKFVGGQGSADGSQKDMQKLDALARAQLKKEQEDQAAVAAALRKTGTVRQQPKRR